MAEDVALHKRAQISKANKTMFIWIAIASVLVGAAAVSSYFMFNILMYGEKVLAEKAKTESTLNHNLSVVDALKSEIRALDANSSLNSVKANDKDRALQVVLDALPSDSNSLALGASFQNKLLLGGGADVTIESINITADEEVADTAVVDASSEKNSTATASTDTTTEDRVTAKSLDFSITVRGSSEGLGAVLKNLERSIRTIQLTTVRISGEANGQMMAITGKAFYEPAKTVELRDVAVPREDKK